MVAEMTDKFQSEKKAVQDLTRQRVYGGLLIFILVAGTSMAVVPSFRERLAGRIHILKAALTEAPSDIIQVGEEQVPYPEEYARSIPTAQQGYRFYVPRDDARKTPAPAAAAPRRILTPKVSSTETPSSDSAKSIDETDDSSPRYQQGKLEQEAYEKALKANETLAEMVRSGGGEELRYQTWDASYRGENVYWVRVIFLDQSNTNVEYIWIVKLDSGQVTPLSHAARKIS